MTKRIRGGGHVTLVFRLAALLVLWAGLAPAPAHSQELASNQENVILFCTNALPEIAPFLAKFRALNPGLRVEVTNMGSSDQFDVALKGYPESGEVPDLILSSGMDLLVKLVNDGYALDYDPAGAAHIPSWLKWQGAVYGITAEPIVFVYNKDLVPAADVPRSHADLTQLLMRRPDYYRGKVATFDVERSGTGLLFATQDVQVTSKSWVLFKAMGQVGVKVYPVASTMVDRVASGDQYIAYNVIGSYAYARAKNQPSLGIVVPNDFALLMSRAAIIPKAAKHPGAAKLLLDFMLSKPGQELLSDNYLGTARDDAGVPEPVASKALVPIRIGPALLTYLDQAKKRRFLKDWRRALQGG